MDDADDDVRESDSYVLAQPSFNDRLTINDFLVASASAGDVASTAAVVAGASPVSLHTPTPPNVGDSDETEFSFELATSSSAHYELHQSQTVTACGKLNSDCPVAFSFVADSTTFSVPVCVSTLHTHSHRSVVRVSPTNAVCCSVLSVCVSVRALNFVCLDLETSFFVDRYISECIGEGRVPP